MTNGIVIISILWLIALVDHHNCSLIKRSASPDLDNSESINDNLNSNYDEYPMVVPKRAAMLLDRIMVALHHALEDNDNQGVQRITDLYKSNRHIAKDARFQKETMHRLRGTEDDINIYGIPFELNEEPGPNGIDIGQYSTDESLYVKKCFLKRILPFHKERFFSNGSPAMDRITSALIPEAALT